MTLDVAYTWVDDRWPGYRDELRAHAASRDDLNPNRTRDNLELLRYSLRSLAAYAPWVRNVHLLTCRPQVPAWLESAHPRLRITHHDQVMDAALLPTFNSFAIVQHLHRLPGISPRFVYFEDDMLLGAPVTPQDFAAYPRLARTRREARAGDSPWTAAVAAANRLLDGRFGHEQRWVHHFPLLIDVELWREMAAQWPQPLERTRASRFRAHDDVAPEFLYFHYARARDGVARASLARSYRECFYFPLENRLAQMRLQRGAVAVLRPKFITLNDNFDARPDPRVEAYVRALLERWLPEPSPFERSSIVTNSASLAFTSARADAPRPQAESRSRSALPASTSLSLPASAGTLPGSHRPAAPSPSSSAR